MAAPETPTTPSDLSVDEIHALYLRAVENDWQTVQATTKQAIERLAASQGAAADAGALMKVARSLVAGEPTRAAASE